MSFSINGVFLWLMLVLVPMAAAQVDCPAVVQAALSATDSACHTTGRNEACYGNISLDITTRAEAGEVRFEQTGDIARLSSIATLRLSSLDAATGVWGVALMKVQANLPDTLPGQNVTFLLFGDVEIENAGETVEAEVRLEMTSSGNINVRSEPSTSGSVVTTLRSGEAVTAVGRVADSSWVMIELPASEGTGWVSAPLLRSEGDVGTLNVRGESLTPRYGPMQAFYFKSGINDAPCGEAPDSGILIQTPEGAGQIDLSVNGVNIQLGSTAYLQAQASGEMTISLVEGAARVEADGVTVGVPAGTRVRVPMDANLNASGAPIGPEPYSDADLVSLPVIPLEREVEIAAALSLEAILDLLVPVGGMWQVTQIGGTCGNRDSRVTSFEIRVSEDGSSFGSGRAIYNQVEAGVYVFEAPETNSRFEAVITSPYSIRLTGQTGTGASCTYDEVWIYSG